LPERALDLTRKAAAVFAERGFENPRLEAELLLAGILGVRRLDLYLQHERPVTAAELERYRDHVRRRLRREPLQYILGTAAFRTLDLAVDPRVLIPRPETEVLAGEVLAWAARSGRNGAALDVGTGSGAIALSLAAEGDFARIVASDTSRAALAVARANAARTGLEGRVEFREGSSLDVVRPGERYAVIASNPPYVADGERDLLPPEVRDHEPAGALFGGRDGLAVIVDLVRRAPHALEPGGLLALEVGAGQADAVVALMEVGGLAGVRIVPDLAGRLRVVLGERAEQKQQEREKAG
jgi:release factor glutamine methyltransferase